jgi:hypothetical protein
MDLSRKERRKHAGSLRVPEMPGRTLNDRYHHDHENDRNKLKLSCDLEGVNN